MEYFPRLAEHQVLEYLKIFPVIGLSGPRQSGKSTMLRQLLQNRYEFVNFDNFLIRQQFMEDPVRFMKSRKDHVVFDEAQYVPDLFPMIKMAVDEDRMTYGKFVITGSGQFMLNKNISESLAGRIGMLTLLPFQFQEIPESMQSRSIFTGSYPELVSRDFQGSSEWYQAYFESYLQKDIKQFLNIGDLYAFNTFVRSLAGQIGQILNISEISRNIGVPVTTLNRWLSVLESSFIVFRLQPFYKNLGKRLVKSPKIYFYDTGLVALLTGIETRQEWEKGVLYGPIFENYMVSEILKRKYHERIRLEPYYYRTSHGEEIDLIMDYGLHFDAVEIKATMTWRPDHLKSLNKIQSEASNRTLVYMGDSFPNTSGVRVMNYREFLSQGM